jgi:hypothetical protein
MKQQQKECTPNFICTAIPLGMDKFQVGALKENENINSFFIETEYSPRAKYRSLIFF